MIKMIIKLIVVIAAFAVSVLLLCYYFAICGAEGFVPWEVAFPVSLSVLYLTGEVGEAWYPQDTLLQKKVFRAISRGLFCAALCLWFSVYSIIIVIAITVMICIFEMKKKSIRKLFDEYLQRQGTSEASVKDTLIRYSLWQLLRDKPAWIIEAEFANTPGIRRFGSIDGVIIPDI